MAKTTQPETVKNDAAGEGSKDPNTPSATKLGDPAPDVKDAKEASTRGTEPTVAPYAPQVTTSEIAGPGGIVHNVGPRQTAPNSPVPFEVPAARSNTRIERPGIVDTGLAGPDARRRLVRVLRKSYLNGAEFEEGAITHWPAGVEKLGPNLEEYKG